MGDAGEGREATAACGAGGSAYLTELEAPVAAPSTPGAFQQGNDIAAARLQLLLPSSEGAEADGQYDRVIRSILDERGHRDVAVVAPDLDKLPCAVDDVEGLFVRLLAGDVALAAPRTAREALRRRLAGELAGCTGAQDALACVLGAAREVAAMPQGAGKRLGLVGEWPIVCGEHLVGGAWAELEQAGHTLVRMPLAEYLLFLWRDAAQADEHERVTNDIMPILGETGVEVTPGMPDFTRRDFGLYTAGVQVSADGKPLDDAQIDFAGTRRRKGTTAAVGVEKPAVEVDFSAGFALDAGEPAVSAGEAAAALQALEGHCGGHGAGCEGGDTCQSQGCASQVDAVSGASLAHIIGPDGMPQSAHEPKRPRLLAYPHKLDQAAYEALFTRLEEMMGQVAAALGDASAFEADQAALRDSATGLIGQFRGANARYRYAKAVALHGRCDGVVEATSMYENVDTVLRLREQELALSPAILHLNFDGTLDAGPTEKLRTFLYYL